MLSIAITSPDFVSDEAFLIVDRMRLFDLIHIRKPGASADSIARLIEQIPEEYRRRLVLHDHHELAMEYGLHGVHLNRRNPVAPSGFHGSVSRSCHSLEEVVEWKRRCDYVFLSPIYDSISKRGYRSAFSMDELRRAHDDGIIDRKVVALGGVTPDRIDELRTIGFGGYAMLGAAWKLT